MSKKFFVSLLVLLSVAGSCTCLNAQSFSLGGGFTYGSLIENAGFNLRGFFNANEKIRVGTDFTGFFPRTRSALEICSNCEGHYRLTAWELNFNGNYLVEVSENFQVYPLFGFNITGAKTVYDYDIVYHYFWGTVRERYYNVKEGTRHGANFGGGLQYKINQLAPYFEFKYVASDYDQVVINLGLLYTFE